ncbi:hypothetical protein Bca4012_080215 [Brassica carinata]
MICCCIEVLHFWNQNQKGNKELMMMRTWNTYQFSEELLFQKKISGGVKKNGGQGDVVVVGFTSHRFRLDEEDLRDPVRRRIHVPLNSERLEEIGFYFNMRYFEDTVTVGEFG